MIIDKDFVKEIEKTAIPFMAAGVAALTAMDVKDQAKRRRDIVNLGNPMSPGSSIQKNQYKLGNPNQFQFEGGKHTNLKATTSPHSSLY